MLGINFLIKYRLWWTFYVAPLCSKQFVHLVYQRIRFFVTKAQHMLTLHIPSIHNVKNPCFIPNFITHYSHKTLGKSFDDMGWNFHSYTNFWGGTTHPSANHPWLVPNSSLGPIKLISQLISSVTNQNSLTMS